MDFSSSIAHFNAPHRLPSSLTPSILALFFLPCPHANASFPNPADQRRCSAVRRPARGSPLGGYSNRPSFLSGWKRKFKTSPVPISPKPFNKPSLVLHLNREVSPLMSAVNISNSRKCYLEIYFRNIPVGMRTNGDFFFFFVGAVGSLLMSYLFDGG